MIEFFYYLFWLFIFFVPEIFYDKLFFSEKLINKYKLIYRKNTDEVKKKIIEHYVNYCHYIPAVIFSFHNMINPSSKLFPMIKYNATAYVISDFWAMYNKKQSNYNRKIKTVFLIYHHCGLVLGTHVETKISIIDYVIFVYDFRMIVRFLFLIHALNSNNISSAIHYRRYMRKYIPIIKKYFSFPFMSCIILYMLYSNMSNSFISQRILCLLVSPVYVALLLNI